MEDKDFIQLIRRSRKIEWEICQWYRRSIDPQAKLALPKTKGYDIISPAVGNVEVKEDRLAVKTDHYALEFEDQNGQKSGIAGTTAGEFVLVDEEMVVRMKVTSLLFTIRDTPRKRMIQMGYTTREGQRAWGYLIPRRALIFSPYAETVARWF